MMSARHSQDDSSIFPLTRQSLLARLYGEVDHQAWEQFFDVYSGVVYRMARARGLGEQDAEETAAAVIRNVASAFRNGRKVRGRLRRYLRVVTNRQINRERFQGNRWVRLREDLTEQVVEPAGPELQWQQIEEQERLRVCLDRVRHSEAIRPRDFAVFEALVLQGEPVKVVARRYRVTQNRVYSIKHKLIKILRELKLRLDVELGEV